MKNSYILPTILLAGTVLSACSMQPTKTSLLDDARSGYRAAQSNPEVTKLAPVEFQQAGIALDKANEASTKREELEVINHLAYLAKQRVAIAQETAKLKAAELAVTDATAARDKVRLEARTAEADAAKEQALMSQQDALLSQQSADQKAAELAAANDRVAQMEAELTALNAKKTERGMVITLGDVLFDTNKAELRSGGVDNVQKLADFFTEYPERKALIEGYTDSTGSSDYNQDLSDRRANAVRGTLLRMGVSGLRVTTRGYGEEKPIADNETASGRQMNRRVEIVLSDDANSGEPQ